MSQISHSEILRKRKGPKDLQERISKQFSMQSDVTETVEVSERSFNDKLGKLQIHSF